MEPTIAQPSSPVAPASYEANMFTLHGRHMSVSFSATSITGQPLLYFKDRHREVSAWGREIRQVESELGTLVTITLEPDADAGEFLFSMLLPRVTLTELGAEETIRTVGFFTRTRLPPRLPASTQLQTYDTVDLKGTATFVVS
jgi:hypothetical protein